MSTHLLLTSCPATIGTAPDPHGIQPWQAICVHLLTNKQGNVHDWCQVNLEEEYSEADGHWICSGCRGAALQTGSLREGFHALVERRKIGMACLMCARIMMLRAGFRLQYGEDFPLLVKP